MQRRAWIGDIEPPLVPTLQRHLDAKPEVLIASPLAELETGAPDYIDLVIFLIWLEDEEVTEKI